MNDESPPTLQPLDAEGDKLMEMAQQFDETGQLPEEKPEVAAQEPVEGETLPEPPEIRTKEAEEGVPVEGEELKPPTEKEESAYRKAVKEQQRKEKTWQQIEAEKASVRAEEARIEQEKASIEAEKARNFLQSMPRARHNGFTADEYANASRSFTQEAIKAYKDGDTDKGDASYRNAQSAAHLAQQLSAQEQQFYQQHVAQEQQKVLDHDFTSSLQEAIEENPDAGQAGTPLANETQELLKNFPWIYYVPGGGRYVVEIAQMRLAMRDVQALRDENAALKEELGKRDKASQPLRGGPTTPGKTRGFDEMNLEEKEAYLEHASEMADANY